MKTMVDSLGALVRDGVVGIGKHAASPGPGPRSLPRFSATAGRVGVERRA